MTRIAAWSGSKNISLHKVMQNTSPKRADSPASSGFRIVFTGRSLHKQIQHLGFPNKEGAVERSLVSSDTTHGGFKEGMLCWESEGGIRPRCLSQIHIDFPKPPLSYIERDCNELVLDLAIYTSFRYGWYFWGLCGARCSWLRSDDYSGIEKAKKKHPRCSKGTPRISMVLGTTRTQLDYCFESHPSTKIKRSSIRISRVNYEGS